jgi:hypothetical protein
LQRHCRFFQIIHVLVLSEDEKDICKSFISQSRAKFRRVSDITVLFRAKRVRIRTAITSEKLFCRRSCNLRDVITRSIKRF